MAVPAVAILTGANRIRSEAMANPPLIHDVKAIKFESYKLSADGQMIVLMVKDRADNQGWIGLDWHDVPGALALIKRQRKPPRRFDKNSAS
jgi:hypothetical protein